MISPDRISTALGHLDADGMIAFLQQLVRTPSVYMPGVPGANETAAALLIAELLRSWGWHVLVEEAAPGRPNVIAELHGSYSSGPLLLMEGHTDVVTPGDVSAWSREPFSGAIEGGRLYGRGAVDMKGGLAAMLFAGRAIQLAGAPFKGTLRLLIPVDEEGMMLGIKQVVANGHAAGAIGCIVCEPEGGEVCVAQKGSLRLHLCSHGRIAHGAMPHTGVNALSGLVRWLNQVLDLAIELNNTHPAHPLLGPLYISPTIASAGEPAQINVLPGFAEAYLDIRSIPAISHEPLISRIRACAAAVCAGCPEYRFDLHVIDDRPATEIAPQHPLVCAISSAHRQIYGATAPLGGVPGSTDGTILVRDAGVPVVVYGPGNKWLPHQPDEHVELTEVIRAAQVYILAVLDLLGKTDEC